MPISIGSVLRAAVVFGVAAMMAGCQKSAAPTPSPASAPQVKPAPPQTELAEPTPVGKSQTRRSGLVYETLKEGTGPLARTGDQVTVHYTGTLEDGKIFDSSREDDRPMIFEVGDRKLLQGWNEGIAGMKVGERRKLTLPPNIAYGALGRLPKIPPNATLVFDVELVKIGSDEPAAGADKAIEKSARPEPARAEPGQEPRSPGPARKAN